MSVGIELPDEIERVSAKRERWRRYADEMETGVAFAPGIALMTAAIDEAKAALASDDAIRAIMAYRALKRFVSQD